MAEQARITNLDVIESFRSALVVFSSKARQSLDSAQEAVRRTRAWLQTEQPAHWAAQVRLRQKRLDQARQELMSARLSEFVDAPVAQQMAVRKATAALEEAQMRLERTKHWAREYDRVVDPLVRRLDTLRDFLDNDLVRAAAQLVEMQKLLASYHETPSPPSAA